MSVHKVQTMIDGSMRVFTNGVGERFAGAFLKAANPWTQRGHWHTWQIHLLDSSGGRRVRGGLSKRRAKAAMLNWVKP